MEQLLELGPNNVQALKLMASLYVHQGRFDEEEQVWRRVEIDNEDDEAIGSTRNQRIVTIISPIYCLRVEDVLSPTLVPSEYFFLVLLAALHF